MMAARKTTKPGCARCRAELAKIHMAAKALGMDTTDPSPNSDYRAMLRQHGGKTSAGELDAAGRARVLDHLRRAGAQATPRKRVAQHPGTPHNLGREAMLQKIEAYLADMKLPWYYADTIARQQTGIERVAWLRKQEDLRGVIAALHVEQEKRGLLETLDERLAALGMTREGLAEQRALRAGWMRHRPTLRRLIADLAGEVC